MAAAAAAAAAYLEEAFEDGRDAALAKDGSDAVAVADAVAALAAAGLGAGGEAAREDVDELFGLRRTVGHLVQVEQGAVGLERQRRAKVFGHGQLAAQLAVAAEAAHVAHRVDLLGVEAEDVLRRRRNEKRKRPRSRPRATDSKKRQRGHLELLRTVAAAFDGEVARLQQVDLDVVFDEERQGVGVAAGLAVAGARRQDDLLGDAGAERQVDGVADGGQDVGRRVAVVVVVVGHALERRLGAATVGPDLAVGRVDARPAVDAAAAESHDGEAVAPDAGVAQGGVDGGGGGGQPTVFQARLLVDDEDDVGGTRRVAVEGLDLAGAHDVAVLQFAADAVRRHEQVQSGQTALADVGGGGRAHGQRPLGAVLVGGQIVEAHAPIRLGVDRLEARPQRRVGVAEQLGAQLRVAAARRRADDGRVADAAPRRAHLLVTGRNPFSGIVVVASRAESSPSSCARSCRSGRRRAADGAASSGRRPVRCCRRRRGRPFCRSSSR